MQMHCSTHSVILNALATQYTCSLNSIYHWPVQWSHHCSPMHIPVHSPWLPGYIDVMQIILAILTTAGLFLDRPRMYICIGSQCTYLGIEDWRVICTCLYIYIRTPTNTNTWEMSSSHPKFYISFSLFCIWLKPFCFIAYIITKTKQNYKTILDIYFIGDVF